MMATQDTATITEFRPAVRFEDPQNVVRLLPPVRRTWREEIADLVDAAGPLTLEGIAGGLDVPAGLLATDMEWMLSTGALRPDEWGRFRLVGPRAA